MAGSPAAATESARFKPLCVAVSSTHPPAAAACDVVGDHVPSACGAAGPLTAVKKGDLQPVAVTAEKRKGNKKVCGVLALNPTNAVVYGTAMLRSQQVAGPEAPVRSRRFASSLAGAVHRRRRTHKRHIMHRPRGRDLQRHFVRS